MRRILPILVLLALSACIYPYTQEIPQEEKEMRILVVYGDMIFGEESSIALSFVTPLGDYSRKNVICDGPVVLTGHKSSTPGKYVNIDLAPIVTYALGVKAPDTWQGKVPYNMFTALD